MAHRSQVFFDVKWRFDLGEIKVEDLVSDLAHLLPILSLAVFFENFIKFT